MKPSRVLQLLAVVACSVFLLAPPNAATSAEAPPIYGPFISNITSESAVIWWQSDAACPGKVVVGKEAIVDRAPPFEVLVPDLDPATVYEYWVEFTTGERRPTVGKYVFRTAPASDSDEGFRFAVMCDSRGNKASDPVNEAVLQTMLAAAKLSSAQFVCFPGDLILGYCDEEDEYREQLRLWKAAAADVLHEVPIYVTMGNHDVLVHEAEDDLGKYQLDGVKRDGGLLTGEEAFAEEFVNPTNGPGREERGAPPYTETCYSFDYGNSHFVVLNTNYWVGARSHPPRPGDPCRLYGEGGNPEGRIMDRQMAWLADDLQRARGGGAQHIFVFGHEPAFPVGKHADDGMYYEGNATVELKREIRKQQREFWRMLGEHNVLAAFFGDEHNYSRGLIGPAGDVEYAPPVWQIITGGAGAELSDKRLEHLPWADSIRVFEDRYHFSLVTVQADRVSLDVYALPADPDPVPNPLGLELIDHVRDLTTLN